MSCSSTLIPIEFMKGAVCGIIHVVKNTLKGVPNLLMANAIARFPALFERLPTMARVILYFKSLFKCKL